MFPRKRAAKETIVTKENSKKFPYWVGNNSDFD